MVDNTKRAVQRLIRQADGTLAIVYIDLKTLQPILPNQVGGYKVINSNNPVEEHVQSFNDPNTVHSIKETMSGKITPVERLKSVIDKLDGKPHQRPAEINQSDVQRLDRNKPTDGSPYEGPGSTMESWQGGPLSPDRPDNHAYQQNRPAGTERQADTNLSGGPSNMGFLGSKLAPGHNIDSHINQMDATFRDRLSDMLRDAPPGIAEGLGVTSGHRTRERQQQLFDASDRTGRRVGTPDGSKHVKGVAADLNYNGLRLDKAPPEVQSWVKENAPKYGLNLPMSYEPWHVETTEARNGTFSAYQNVNAIPQPRPEDETVASEIIGDVKDVAKPEGIDSPLTQDVSGMPAGQMRNLGIGNFPERTQEEKEAIAHALAGELSKSSLDGLMASDPTAMAEYGNMISSIENRAASDKFGSIGKTLTGSQYNSLMPDNLATTNDNFANYRDALMANLDSFYSGGLTPTQPGATNYHADYVNPGWSSKMKDPVDAGRHRFGILDSQYDNPPGQDFKAERDRMAASQDRNPGKFTGKPDYSGGDYYSDKDSPREKSGLGPGQSLGTRTTGFDSPSEKGSRFGGTGLGSPSTNTGTSNHSTEHERDSTASGLGNYGGMGGQKASERSGGLW